MDITQDALQRVTCNMGLLYYSEIFVDSIFLIIPGDVDIPLILKYWTRLYLVPV